MNAKNPKTLVIFTALGLLLSGCLSIGNFGWHDLNGNGIQDSGEPGVEGVRIHLVSLEQGPCAGLPQGCAGPTFPNTPDLEGDDQSYTNEIGGYEVEPDFYVWSASFYLEVIPPAGYVFTLQDQGNDDALDSDVDPATGRAFTGSLDFGAYDNFDVGLVLEEALATVVAEIEQLPTTTPTPTPTPQPGGALEQVCYGPNPEDFPEGYSPLTGLPVDDASLLSLRPVFVSISIFPPSVRPPTGLAVSPIVYELYIGDGDTRLMAGFYGQFPQPSYEGVTGEGNAPEGFDVVIGDLVWFDSNGNHLQDEGEPGVADVPVRLVDVNFNEVATTTTDTTGHFYFGLNDVAENTEFQLRFGAPPSISDYYWVNKDVGADDAVDSDVTDLGRTDLFDPTDSDYVSLNLDAGVRQAQRIEGLRSGRVAYQDLQINYCGCLVTAGADPTVAAQINTCASAFGNDPSDIGGAGLDVTQLQAVASNNSEGSCSEPNLTGNMFCTQPSEGTLGSELFVEYNVNNVDHFVYNPELGAFTWAKNLPSAPETFEVMTDRLTGETLTFENVIVMLVQHTSQNSAGTIIDLDMDHKTGTAYIFRNGMAYEARWTTVATPYEQTTGKPLPVRFTDLDGNPFPLAPGQVWINLLNAFDSVQMGDGGIWYADFDAPPNP